MPADRGERTARTKRAGRSDDETARSDERSEDRAENRAENRAKDTGEGATEETAERTGDLDVAGAAQVGRRLIGGVTGKEPEGVTSVEPADTGWLVEVEVLEDRHIPSSADVLALYEVELDPDGALLSYRRARRYTRGRGNGGSGGGGES